MAPKAKKWNAAKKGDAAAQHAVFFESADALKKARVQVSKYPIVSVPSLCEKLKINCSLARRLINIMVEEKELLPLVEHHRGHIYRGAAAK